MKTYFVYSAPKGTNVGETAGGRRPGLDENGQRWRVGDARALRLMRLTWQPFGHASATMPGIDWRAVECSASIVMRKSSRGF
eukprot:8606902-Pyramimonas_sp.AAC.1